MTYLRNKNKTNKVVTLAFTLGLLILALAGPVLVKGETATPQVTVNLLSPQEGKTYTSSLVLVSFTYTKNFEGGTPSYRLYLNGKATYFLATQNGDVYSTYLSLPNGDHYMSIGVEVFLANSVPFNKLGYSQVVHFEVKEAYLNPPTITILSPAQNASYNTTDPVLMVAVSRPTAWLGYSLDNQSFVRIPGNITLTGLDPGPHSIIVNANDTAGNMGSSITTFTLASLPSPTPTSSPSPSTPPSNSPTQQPTNTPSNSPNPSTSEQPSPTPTQEPTSPTPSSQQEPLPVSAEIIYVTAIVVVILVIVAVAFVLRKKK